MNNQQPTTTRISFDIALTAVLGAFIISLTLAGPLMLISIVLAPVFPSFSNGAGGYGVLFFPFALLFFGVWFALLFLFHAFIYSKYPRGSSIRKALVIVFIASALLSVIGSFFLKKIELTRVNESVTRFESSYQSLAGTWRVLSEGKEYRLAFDANTPPSPYSEGFPSFQKLQVNNLTDNRSYDCTYKFDYVPAQSKDDESYLIGMTCPYLQAKELFGETAAEKRIIPGYENTIKETWYYKTDSIKNSPINLIPNQSADGRKALVLQK